MEKIIKYVRDKKVAELIYAIVLVVFTIAYHSIWINRTYVMPEAWAEFYDGIIAKGKIPYKDFYYQMPPINLLFDHIIWNLSFGYVIVYRIWRLFERLVIIIIGYKILAKKVNPFIACLSGMLVCIMQAANVHDLCGDYNQTNNLLIMIVTILLLKYVEVIHDKKRFMYAFFVGVCGGLMLLMKQPLVFACGISYFILLIILVVKKKEKNGLKVLFSIIAGSLIPVLIGVMWLLYHGCLRQCVEQVFMDTSAKGSTYNILVGKLLSTFYDKRVLMFAMLFLLVFYYYKGRIDCKNINTFFVVMPKLSLIFSVFLIVSYYWNFMLCSAEQYSTTGMLFLLVVQLGLISIDNIKNHFHLCYICSIIMTFVVLIINPNNLTKKFAINANLNGCIASGLSLIFCGIVVWVFYHIFEVNNTNDKEIDLSALVVAFSAIASGYVAIMTNGEVGVVTFAAFTLIPSAIYIVFRNSNPKMIRYGEITLQVLVILILGICLAQKLTCAYSWWGDVEASYWDKTEKSNIRALKGFKFSKEEIERYDCLNEVISANSDEKSVIWGFPYVKAYNLFQDNYNMTGFVPVLFYDVCSDRYAEKESQMLKENPPDIVIWQDIDECIEQYEAIFRDGTELGQRQIMNWFASSVDTNYTLIGQVGDTFVYKLKDNEGVNKTYIKSKYSINNTGSKSLKLEGLGCKSIPYCINSYEDLVYLRDQVNAGHNMSGVYFEQTADIEILDKKAWSPIGEAGTKGFDGIYNGNGYKITGMYMLSEDDEDLALFGELNGKVCNLVINDAWIGGQNIALIAVDGSGTIVNCCASGILYGYNSSGIAYSTSGYIENSVAIINVEKGTSNGIIGSYSKKIYNCYSNIDDGTLLDSGELINANMIDNLNNYVKKNNSDVRNDKLLYWELVDGIPTLVREK